MVTSLIHQEIQFELILNSTEQLYLMKHADTGKYSVLSRFKLSVEEVVELHTILQNPLQDKEPELDQECRSAIWWELHNCLQSI